MIKKDIVSIPIRITLIDTSRIDAKEQSEYPQMMIKPSPSHYPQFIDSPTESLISSADTEGYSKPSSGFCDFFTCFSCLCR